MSTLQHSCSHTTMSRVLIGLPCSSLSAMHGLTTETPPLRGSRFTEEDWNEDSSIENGQFYPLSKVRNLPLLLHDLTQ